MRGSFSTLFLAAALSNPASAGQEQVSFTVGVTVPVRVSLEIVEEPELTLTDEDVARGYKDVSAQYVVRHNDRNGYLIELKPRGDVAQRVEIRGLGVDVVVRRAIVDVHQPGDAFQQDLSLQFHCVLDASSRPGTFELPVAIAATPL